jgi:thiol-disulfide isomerase/thioredoxin
MNVYEEGDVRRDGFQPYSRSQFQNALNAWVTVVLYFSADRCPTCQLLTTALEADQFAFPDDLLVLSIDFDTQTDLVAEYGVARQHTLIVLDAEGDEKSRSVWTVYTLAELEAEVNAM